MLILEILPGNIDNAWQQPTKLHDQSVASMAV